MPLSDDQKRRLAARMNVAEWLGAERVYADGKWATGDNADQARNAIKVDPTGEWYLDYVRSYLHRASTLGLDNPLGRQALGKATVTLLHCLETVWEIHGKLPEPGHPSGEIH